MKHLHQNEAAAVIFPGPTAPNDTGDKKDGPQAEADVAHIELGWVRAKGIGQDGGFINDPCTQAQQYQATNLRETVRG